MKIKITIVLFLLLGFELGAQIFNFKPDDGPIKVKTSTDYEIITNLFKELQHSINVSGGFTNRFISEDYENEPHAKKMANDLKVININLENINIEIRDELSIVKAVLLLSDGRNVEDSLILKKTENRWLIKESKYLVQLNELKQNNNRGLSGFTSPRIQSFNSQQSDTE